MVNPVLEYWSRKTTPASTPETGARQIDFATPLPEMSPDAAPLDDTLAFPQDMEDSLAPLEDVNAAVESAPAATPEPTLPNPVLEYWSRKSADQASQQQAATQQAVTEATTPDDRLPVISPDLADALGVLDYRDPQEGQRRQQAAAIGEILNLPMFERVNLGAAPVNPDGTVTIRRAQAVSPAAQAAADEQMEIIRLAAAKNLNPPTPSFLEKIQQRWRLGRESAADDQLAYRAMMGEVDWNQVKNQLDPSQEPQRGGNWFSEGFLGAVQMLPPMVDGIISGNKLGLQGAMAGGTAAAIAGQVGPQVITPEEIVTVPAAAALGYSAGQAAGSSEYWYKQGAGSMYHALRKEGIPHEIASNVSAGFGAPYAGIELAQVTKLVPGLKQTAAQAVAGGLKKRLTALAVEKTGEYATQIGQETLQEANNITGEALAEWIAGVKPPPEKASAWDRIAGTIKESALSIPFLMAPKGVVDTVQTVRGPAQQNQPPPPAPVGTPSSPTAPPSSAPQPAPAEVPQNFTPISSPATAPGPVSPAPAPQNLGQVRAPEIPIDQTALDEAFGSPFAPPQPAPADLSDSSIPSDAPAPRPALSFSTDAITPEQTSLATDFSSRLTGQLRTQGILDTASTLDLTPVNLDRVDAGAPLADFIDNFSRLTSTRIQFVKASDPTIFGGAVRSDDAQTIYLNADSQRPVAALVGHEFGHTLQYSNPALYKDLRRVVATYTDSYRTRARESAASPIYQRGPATQRVRTQTAELTNNTLGDAFLDPEFWRSVQNENRPLIQKIWTSFNEWVDSLLTRQSQATWGTPQFATDLTALRRDLAKTIAPALRPPTKSFGNAQVTANPSNIDLAIEAYHGTPHKVDRFSTKKIGTGEGAQVYGWGLYFAENKSVGEEYRKRLSESALTLDGVPIAEISGPSKNFIWSHAQQYYADGAKTKDALLNKLKAAQNFEKQRGNKYFKDDDFKEVIDAVSTSKEVGMRTEGNLYSVSLDVEPEDLLDWDKPLSEQSEKVQGILQKWADDPELWESMKTWKGNSFYGTNLKDDAAKQKSEFLLRLGIPGIRYLDGGSRGYRATEWANEQAKTKYADPGFTEGIAQNYLESTQGDLALAIRYLKESGPEQFQIAANALEDGDILFKPTYNYVAFDENLIKITAENGQPVSREIAFAQESSQTDSQPAVIPSISFAAENQYKPTDIILSPTGHKDWGVFTDLDETRSKGKIKSLPIRLLKGRHFGPNKGYGIEHIRAEHEQDFAVFQEPLENVLHRLLLDFNEVYLQADGRLALLSRRPTMVSVVELREEKGGFYSVVTGFPKENPGWKPAGARILDGRRAVFAQSARAPGPTAQGTARPNPPLEPLPGKYSVEYAMSLRQPVNKNVDGNISAAAEPRSFPQTVAAAPGVAPEVKAQLTALDYDPTSNAQTLASARARIDAAGSMDAALSQLTGKSTNRDFQPTAVDYAVAIELLGELQARGRYQDAGGLADFMASAATAQGQAIQALSLISRLTPAGIEVFAARQLQRAARNDPKIEQLIQDNERLRAEIATAKRDSATAAIVDNRAAIKAALPAGADPVATNIAIREAILQSPTPLAAQAATARILQDNGLSEKSAIRIAQSITKDFLKTTTDSRAKVLQDLLAIAETDRRLNKSKLGALIRLNREGKLSDSRLHADMAKMLGIPAWTAEHSAKVQRLINERERATDPRVKLVKAAEALDVIYREAMPPGILDKVDTYQTMAMLLNGLTQVRNLVGNISMAGVEIASDTVAQALDAVVGLGTGQRTRTGLDLGTRLTELGAGFQDIRAGYQFARSEGKSRRESFKEGVQTLIRLGRIYSSGKYDSQELTRYTGPVFNNPVMQTLENTLGAALSLADRGFYESAFKASLQNRMRTAAQNGTPMLAPDPEMIEQARMDAARAIYQDENIASKIFGGSRKLINLLTGSTRWGIGSMIFKFVQVPGSILMRSLEYSPVNTIRVLYETVAPLLPRTVSRYHIGKDFDQKAFTDALARTLVGSGFMATGYWLANLGILSGGMDSDDENERELAKAEGWGPYRLNVSALQRAMVTGNFWTRQQRLNTDKVIKYDWLAPMSVGIAMGANLREGRDKILKDLQSGKRTSDFATTANWLLAAAGETAGVAASAMNTVLEQPMLSNLNQFFVDAGHGDPISALVKTAADIPGTMIPTVVKQWARYEDNTVRETRDGYDGKLKFRQTVNELKAMLPGVSKTLPPRYDMEGNIVERFPNNGNTFFNVALNPAFVGYIKKSKLLSEMSDVYKATADGGVVPSRIKPKVSLENVEITLMPDEISALQKEYGMLSVAAAEKFIFSDPYYEKATWEQRANALQKALTMAAKAAKYRVLQSRPDLYQRAKAEHIQRMESQRAANQQAQQDLAAVSQAMSQLQPGP